MPKPYMGFPSEQAYVDAINTELARLEYHDTGGRESLQPKPKSKKVLRGKPGSKERLAQVAQVSGVPVEQIQQDWGRTQAGQRLIKAVKTMRQVGFVGEEYTAALDAVMELDDPNVAQQTLLALPGELAEYFQDALIERIEERDAAEQREAEKAEENRLATREAMYAQEYDLAESVSPDALDAVDSMAQGIGAETLYDENVDPHQALATLRAAGVMGESQRAAMGQLGTQQAIIEELKRGEGAPGSSWTDAERERWEQEIDEAALASASRHLVLPDEAAEYAVETVMGPPAPTFKDAVQEELKRYDRPEHADRLRDLAVSEWEAQHPETR